MVETQDTQNKSPVIRLPKDSDLVEKLKRKWIEYRGRVKNLREELRGENVYSAPEVLESELLTSDSFYKFAILTQLFLNGEVDTRVHFAQLSSKGSFDSDNYNIAASVIDDYCKTGGEKVSGGTGLR